MLSRRFFARAGVAVAALSAALSSVPASAQVTTPNGFEGYVSDLSFYNNSDGPGVRVQGWAYFKAAPGQSVTVYAADNRGNTSPTVQANLWAHGIEQNYGFDLGMRRAANYGGSWTPVTVCVYVSYGQYRDTLGCKSYV
ncbi:hypothetical protein [Streptomyces sp. NPDC051909]|uniref:hypothetical protein n=1 Tax=Streptomyces sp. NPDC051909 TaxID=3154944 RepID=UPI0034314CD1